MVRRAAETLPDGTPKGEVTLPDGGAPYIAPGVDPGVAAYQAGIAARRAGALPKVALPLEQPRPPIPVLAGGPSPGRGGVGTMADYARAERAAGAAPPIPGGIPPGAPGSIIEEGPPPSAAPSQRRPVHTVASLGLAPADLLPEAAKSDPEYRVGHGSEYASNQPHLAAKYGIVRGGQHIAPQRLGGMPKGLRPETLKDLEALNQLQQGKAVPGLDQDEAATRRHVEAGMGGAAARVGNEPGDNNIKAPTDEQRAEVLKRAIDQMDAFQFNEWRQLTMRQILHSEEEREAIEKRLTPLDIGELIATNVIRQRIPIIPGKYEVTLQSYDGQVDLALKRLVMQESRSVDVGDQYTLDKYSFMTLAVGLHKINDKPYPDIFDANGVFSDELFLKKFNMVMKLPIHMLASIGVNQMWFEMRVRRLYSATALGNG
jgi:hypothetical protein